MPAQKPGQSEQVVCTPPAFLKAIKNRFDYIFADQNGEFAYDLAASTENTVAPLYYTEEDDSLIQPWHEIKGVCWCNPPYGSIEPWVQKACAESLKGAEVLMLLPASVGSNWWRDYVDQKAWSLFLNGRLTFVGHSSPYPKDLALVFYSRAFLERSHYSIWNWRKNL